VLCPSIFWENKRNMAIPPRLMIVDSVCTFPEEKKQTIGLALLNRADSDYFYNRFPNGAKNDLGEVLEYARKNSVEWIAAPNIGFRHKAHHEVQGVEYHLGDTVTEAAAVIFGYVEPCADTYACRVAKTVHDLRKEDNEAISRELRKKALIEDDYSAAVSAKRIHILSNVRMEQLRHIDASCGLDCYPLGRDHPLDIMRFPPNQDGIMPVGVLGFYLPQINRIYEFMTQVEME
jgi:hypothetical protein